MVSLFMISAISVIGVPAQTYANYTTDTTNQCTTATTTLFISTETSGTAFNTTVTLLVIKKAECMVLLLLVLEQLALHRTLLVLKLSQQCLQYLLPYR